MNKKDNDPFGFNKVINWDKLEDPKVLKELEKIFNEEEQASSTKPQASSLTGHKLGDISRIIKEKF